MTLQPISYKAIAFLSFKKAAAACCFILAQFISPMGVPLLKACDGAESAASAGHRYSC